MGRAQARSYKNLRGAEINKQATVKLDDLEEALMFVGSGDMFGNVAWVCRDTGEVIWHSVDIGDFGPLPEDIDDSGRYIAIPNQRDLGLSQPLALEFARTQLPECFEQVQRIFSRRGAYARFKDLLDRRDSLDALSQWEQDKTRQALREWCADNGIPLSD